MALKSLELTTCVISSAASLCNMMQLYLQDITLHNFSYFMIPLAYFELKKMSQSAVHAQYVASNSHFFHNSYFFHN